MATQNLDPVTLLSILNTQFFNLNTDENKYPTTQELVALSKTKASPYGSVTIKKPKRKMTFEEFFQRFIIPIAFDLFTAKQLKKPLLDDKTIEKLKKEVPDIEKYIQKDEKTQQYKFIELDKAPEHIKNIYSKLQEIEEARQKILTNPRVFLQPGYLTIMMQNPLLASVLFDVSGQLLQSVREGKKKQATQKVTEKLLEKMGIDTEGTDLDIQTLMPLLLYNYLK